MQACRAASKVHTSVRRFNHIVALIVMCCDAYPPAKTVYTRETSVVSTQERTRPSKQGSKLANPFSPCIRKENSK
eukprot:3502326-Amphidinium_carterae.2